MKTTAVLFAVMLSGCASLSQWDKQKLLAPVAAIPDQTPMLIQEYNRALADAQAHPRSERAIRDYTEASIALVDTACLQWLDRVSLASQQSRLGASTLDVTSALATTSRGPVHSDISRNQGRRIRHGFCMKIPFHDAEG